MITLKKGLLNLTKKLWFVERIFRANIFITRTVEPNRQRCAFCQELKLKFRAKVRGQFNFHQRWFHVNWYKKIAKCNQPFRFWWNLTCFTPWELVYNISVPGNQPETSSFWLPYKHHCSSVNCVRADETLKRFGKSSSRQWKKIFVVRGCRFFVSDVISEVTFWIFWLMLPGLGPNHLTKHFTEVFIGNLDWVWVFWAFDQLFCVCDSKVRI